jgi:PKHD-type hydroxylase
MLLIADVLTAEEIDRVRKGLSETAFADGKRTAGGAARAVKANRQARGDDDKVQALARFVRQGLERSAAFSIYARPAKWSAILFNRYGPGERYGLHMDDAMMGEGEGQLRTDLSFTLFLSDPETYEGGELVLEGNDGERSLKAEAGTLALYSTGVLHRVEPVTSGERMAAVGWVQSLVRRADQREILFDLSRIRDAVEGAEPQLLMDRSIGNLMRLWAEP